MRLVLAACSIGAVIFLLRVLVGFVKEEWKSSPHTAEFHWARFHPSRRPGELIVMPSAVPKGELPTGPGEQVAS